MSPASSRFENSKIETRKFKLKIAKRRERGSGLQPWLVDLENRIDKAGQRANLADQADKVDLSRHHGDAPSKKMDINNFNKLFKDSG